MKTRCLLLCKGKNFKANHNLQRALDDEIRDVCYYAKVRILKQITTELPKQVREVQMFVIMQR